VQVVDRLKNSEGTIDQHKTISPVRRRIDSNELFRGSRELLIAHREDEYHLRVTRNGKLILTK
jgi:hemin uptake protein HemP